MDALTSDIQEEAPWCMLFADDIVLVGEEGPEVQRRLAKWKERLENVGLKISRTKTEHMFCDLGGSSDFTPIALDGVSLPCCFDFKYLGSILQNDGNIDRDVTNRINAGWMKWRQVSTTACDRRMPLQLKGKNYKTIIRPVVLYESECWATKTRFPIRDEGRGYTNAVEVSNYAGTWKPAFALSSMSFHKFFLNQAL
ncbi:uncharacterized protein LOC114240729 [Bombyx mandarina]|uniref:Uncharacterized protein LOC114240729 n=1 Tax=Bombyx mandarina TaxID=7092 RepID=A0A6J2JCG1_BOMMA|nr:uncharacterized protein LOC114240729 [Bombyx mandarina]